MYICTYVYIYTHTHTHTFFQGPDKCLLSLVFYTGVDKSRVIVVSMGSREFILILSFTMYYIHYLFGL